MLITIYMLPLLLYVTSCYYMLPHVTICYLMLITIYMLPLLLYVTSCYYMLPHVNYYIYVTSC